MNELTIYIFGVIGEEYTSQMLFNQLKATEENTDITVLINSPGGYVDDGTAIYNMLKERDVTVEITGQASSIASVIALAGKEVVINENSFMLIHNPWTWAAGDSNRLDKIKQNLDLYKNMILSAYMEKTGLAQDELTQLMDDETLMTADMALEKGFVDKKVKKSAKAEAMTYMNYYEQSVNMKKENRRMWEKIKALFGFGDDVTEDQALAKIKALKEKDEAGDPPASDPPATQDNELTTQVTNLTKTVNIIVKDQAESKIDNVLDAAVGAGKILPAERDIWAAALEKDFDGTKAKLDAKAKNSAMPGKVKTPEGDVTGTRLKSSADLAKAAADRLRDELK